MDTATNKNNRTKRVNVRLTEQEYGQLLQKLGTTNERKLSGYARKLLLGKPVKVLTRNHSLDLFIVEAAKLRRELNAVGNNFNQVVHKINATPELPQLEFWLKVSKDLQQKLDDKIGKIQSDISKFSERWLHGL